MRRRWVLGLLTALLLGLTPSLARAQSGWYVTPSLTVSESFDDNIFLSSTDRQSDFITRVTPGLRLAYQSVPLSFVASYLPTLEKFVEHPELDNFGNTQSGLVLFNYVSPSEGWTLSLTGAFTRSTNPNDVDPAIDVEGRIVTTSITAAASGSYRLTQDLSILGRAGYSRTELDSPGSAPTDTYTVGVSLRKEFTAIDTGTLNYDFTLFQPEDVGGRAGDTRTSHTGTVGYQRKLTEDLSGSIRVGIRVTDGRVTPDVSVALDGDIRPLPGLSLTGAYSDTVRFVVGAQDPEQVRTLSLSATYAPPWLQYFVMSLRPSVSYVTNLDGSDGRTTFLLPFTATYTYPITSWLNAQLNYAFTYRLNGSPVLHNVVTIGLSTTYPIRVY
jgi:hypothetical protein